MLREGDIVLMDNLKAHKVKGIEDIIRSKGATLQYLPSYSPDFSPIEPCWSKIKESLRSTAARTLRALEKGVTKALNSITERALVIIPATLPTDHDIFTHNRLIAEALHRLILQLRLVLAGFMIKATESDARDWFNHCGYCIEHN
jgi:hypothetical protein